MKMADDFEDVFPDKNLEAAVRETLKKPEGPLTRGDLEGMEELEIVEKAIEDLTGLEHAVNLTGLYLSRNEISDVSPLASLANLTDIRLTNNQASDVSRVAPEPRPQHPYALVCRSIIQEKLEKLEGGEHEAVS
jgi:Leucine-rich repeat (LRR) protein